MVVVVGSVSNKSGSAVKPGSAGGILGVLKSSKSIFAPLGGSSYFTPGDIDPSLYGASEEAVHAHIQDRLNRKVDLTGWHLDFEVDMLRGQAFCRQRLVLTSSCIALGGIFQFGT